MKSRVCAAALILAGNCCLAGDAVGVYEQIVKDMLDSMDRISATLMTVKDRASADAAQAPLQKEALEWQTLRQRADKAPPPSQEEKDRLAKAYKTKLQDASQRLFGEIARVQSVPGGKEALQEVSRALARKK